MTIAVVVSVKDEIELVERSIDHLHGIGVDAIVVCDKGSTDGTRAILDRRRREGAIRVVDVPEGESHEVWVAENLAAVRDAGADWVTFLDADEFLVPRSGRIADCVRDLGTADAVTIERFNVPLSPSGPLMPDELVPDRYDDLWLVTDPIRDYWDALEAHPETSWVRAAVAPRFLVRPHRIGRIGIGGHHVFPAHGASLRQVSTSEVFVAHVPVTTWARFTRKVENIRRLLALHDASFGTTRARHWRRWVAQDDAGRLAEEFARLVLDPSTIGALRDQAVIRSAATVFAEHPAAVGAA